LSGPGDGVLAPPSLARYVDTVALHASQVTDGDLAALRRGGSSDDAVFEITVAAALGAALGRLDRGLAALRGEELD
jgi:alkylhydroperoxidase family enzyme